MSRLAQQPNRRSAGWVLGTCSTEEVQRVAPHDHAGREHNPPFYREPRTGLNGALHLLAPMERGGKRPPLAARYEYGERTRHDPPRRGREAGGSSPESHRPVG